MNQLRYEQLRGLFNKQSLMNFAKAKPGLYSLSDKSKDLLNKFTGNDNLMSLQDYLDLGLNEGSNYISKVATPEILSTMALQGMADSSAVPEAISKGTASIALPFLQSIPGFMGASAQQNQALLGMSDMPRQLREQDYLRRQGVVTTGLTGIPYTPAISTKGGESSLPLFNMFGMGGSI